MTPEQRDEWIDAVEVAIDRVQDMDATFEDYAASVVDRHIARLVDALAKASNRLDWCAGLLPSDTSRDLAGAWADEARDAIWHDDKDGDA